MSVLNKYPQNILDVVDAICYVIVAEKNSTGNPDELKDFIASRLQILIANTIDKAVKEAALRISREIIK